MRRLALLTTLATASLALVPLVPSQAFAHCGAAEVIYARMYHVQVEDLKPVYRIGDKISFKITLTTPAREDPVGLGQPLDPPHTEPAPDVQVSVAMFVGPQGEESFLYGIGTSGAEGKITIPVKIKKYVKPGPAHVRVYGEKYMAKDVASCFSHVWFGDKQMPNAFRVIR